MSFDREDVLTACRTHGTVVRVVVADLRGSAPREVGASMLVWANGFSGTIGGGALEHQAQSIARDMLLPGTSALRRHALGPELGQCCGGSVDLLFEGFDAKAAEAIPQTVYARGPGEMPFQVTRVLAEYRSGKSEMRARSIGDWMIEPVAPPARPLWVWGAGHVGRAVISTLSPLPDFQVTWIDTAAARFPDAVPAGVETIAAADLAKLMQYAPADGSHLIFTYSHEMDLSLCHAALQRGFSFAGLIGSKTKWTRFRSRLLDLGHSPATIETITCPIGQPGLGKHPQAIAVGIATQLLSLDEAHARTRGFA
ncbi:MAG: xanthine dehydrogenase accessory protein XdhC [Pseudomonadota bacterium]